MTTTKRRTRQPRFRVHDLSGDIRLFGVFDHRDGGFVDGKSTRRAAQRVADWCNANPDRAWTPPERIPAKKGGDR